jgi:hypothetical protein
MLADLKVKLPKSNTKLLREHFAKLVSQRHLVSLTEIIVQQSSNGKPHLAFRSKNLHTHVLDYYMSVI